jgi:hypothetical protein
MATGLPPPDPRSLCPLSSTEFCWTLPPKSWVCHCWGLTTLPPPGTNCLEILGALTSWNSKDLSRPVMGLLFYTRLCNTIVQTARIQTSAPVTTSISRFPLGCEEVRLQWWSCSFCAGTSQEEEGTVSYKTWHIPLGYTIYSYGYFGLWDKLILMNGSKMLWNFLLVSTTFLALASTAVTAILYLILLIIFYPYFSALNCPSQVKCGTNDPYKSRK